MITNIGFIFFLIKLHFNLKIFKNQKNSLNLDSME